MNPNPDYIDCDKDETIFQWGDGNLIAGFDPAFKEPDKSVVARYRFEDGKMVLDDKSPHCIEVCEAGAWETQDVADNLEDAILLASSLCETIREEKIRISTPDFKII